MKMVRIRLVCFDLLLNLLIIENSSSKQGYHNKTTIKNGDIDAHYL